jgi:hypothetical protein
MNKPNSTLTKICSSCGQRKPLSAFLHLTAGSHGYGNICSTCRKTALQNPVVEKEESTRSTTGVKIDAKSKVQDAVDKREARKQVEEDYFEQRDKLEEKNIQRSQKIDFTADNEKKHRNFLDRGSFLDRKKTPATQTTAAPLPGSEEQKARENKIDLAAGPVDIMRVAGQVKTQSAVFQSFKTWLGNAPIVSAAERAAKQKNDPKNKTTPDPASEFIHKNSGPKSR